MEQRTPRQRYAFERTTSRDRTDTRQFVDEKGLALARNPKHHRLARSIDSCRGLDTPILTNIPVPETIAQYPTSARRARWDVEWQRGRFVRQRHSWQPH